MIIVLAVLLIFALALTGFLLFTNKKLEREVLRVNTWAQSTVAEAQRAADERVATVYQQSQAAVAEAQKLLDQQFAGLQAESERVRQHYEVEAKKIQEAADALVATTLREVEPLRRFEKFREAEVEAQRELAEALEEAAALKSDAHNLLDRANILAAQKRADAEERVKEIHDQADARLNQAIRDAGNIVAKAEERAEAIGGDAYRALREKDELAAAAEAICNKIEGYGDRYLVPAHSVLDDLAEKFGYDAAAQALKSARALSARMVEQGEAATCDYAEPNRRKTAIQFVIHAFNGEVDSFLSKVMTDNSGTLAQKIKDAFSTVNKDGTAFRNARILPAYLDARLGELASAVRMREFLQRVRDEQRAERERIRDEQRAERERQEKLRAAEREEELKRAAIRDAEKLYADKAAELKAAHEKELTAAGQAGIGAVEEAMRRHAQEIDELNSQHQKEIAEKNQQLIEATTAKIGIQSETRAGSIYIISNEGSFGPDVYKIGFTRRDPEIRVDELYNASVPFEFDIHGVITAENAPELEFLLHRQFLAERWNKKNFGKEFFRVSLKRIREAVEGLAREKDFADKVSWRETEIGHAAEWRESHEIETDLQVKEKWVKQAQIDADERWRKRERRLAYQRQLESLTPAPIPGSPGGGNGSEPMENEVGVREDEP